MMYLAKCSHLTIVIFALRADKGRLRRNKKYAFCGRNCKLSFLSKLKQTTKIYAGEVTIEHIFMLI